ncbi:Transposable element Tcb1 transposase [Labeo rohita]|uniref:Transposable element Tcb1 transposase n=1 Tax=Labeo rohita TaxID=84645 RepID=A0ABQ8MIA3_LABRO|nr:Transposable element Tcb1 transposase [Labeo rohita]
MVSQFGSLGYTIMGKTADLTVVQKTIIDPLHKEENRSLERLAKQNRFKSLGVLHKEWTEAGIQASRATTHRRVKEFGYSCRIPLVKPLLNYRQHQRRLTWAKEKKKWTVAQWSSFQMRASFVFHLETKVLESGGRVEKLIAQVA